MHFDQLNEALYAAFQSKLSVELLGPPGCGKSQSMVQFADWLTNKIGEPVGLITEHLSRLEAIDLGGIPHKMEDESGRLITVFSQPPVFPNAQRFPQGIPKYGILFLDEFRQAGNDVKKPAARLLEERQLGAFKLDEFGHWVVFSASNRSKDRSGVGKEMAFMQNRKAVINMEPSLKAWLLWAKHYNIHPLFVAFAQSHPELVFLDAVPEEEGAFCTPRSLVKTNDYFVALSKINPGMANNHHGLPLESEIAIEFASGLIGEATAAALMAYIRMADELPSFEEICKDPEGTHVPSSGKMDAIYAISQTCAYRVTKETALPVFKYITRFPEENQIATLKTATARNPEIVSNPDFYKWIQKNQKLLMAVAGAK